MVKYLAYSNPHIKWHQNSEKLKLESTIRSYNFKVDYVYYVKIVN